MPIAPQARRCFLCPRACGAERTESWPGFCGADEAWQDFRVARVMLHHWEEPFISGSRGSGAVFFSGCALRCAFCQNRPVSHGRSGDRLSPSALTAAVVTLLEEGAHNINLVTPSHDADRIPAWLETLKATQAWQSRPVPVVWNSSAYETPESIAGLAGSVDIFLPDLKFASPGLASDLAGAPDYPPVALAAIQAMLRLQPDAVFDSGGLLRRGVVIRHLVLPGHWRDSLEVMRQLARSAPLQTPLSLMCQYTPQETRLAGHPELDRRLTTWEYRQVLDAALDLGFTNILGQERASASSAYTPDFAERLRPGRC